MEITAVGGQAKPEPNNATSFNWWLFTKRKSLCRSLYCIGLYKSGREDLNLRPLRPERSALAKLSYSPKRERIFYRFFIVSQPIINLPGQCQPAPVRRNLATSDGG